jgi:hypothetical protein
VLVRFSKLVGLPLSFFDLLAQLFALLLQSDSRFAELLTARVRRNNAF